MNQPDTLLQATIAIAIDAGKAIMKVYESDFAVQAKDDKSPLTEADLAAHHLIVAGLEKLDPKLPVLSEESTAVPYETRKTWNRYWLVDPLDGTKEFVKRNGEFTVNIALIDNGIPVLGVVYAPAKEVLYYGDANGAFKQIKHEQAVSITTKAMDPSKVVIAGSRSHSDHRMESFINNIQKNQIETDTISLGSSLKICLVAEGVADVYPRLGPTSEWDTGAAHAVLNAAGGSLVELNMQTLGYNAKESVLNPEFFACSASQHDWSQYLEAK